MLRFEGIDVPKEFEKHMALYRPYAELLKEEPILGHDNLEKRFLHLYPKYEGLKQYNAMFVQEMYTLNTRAFCEKLSDFLIEKRSNVSLIYGHSVDAFIFHEEEDKKHLIKALKLRKQDALIECDAVVLCAGSFVSRVLKEHFGVICPVIPVKGYSFDMPTDT